MVPFHQKLDFDREYTELYLTVAEKYFEQGTEDRDKCFDHFLAKHNCTCVTLGTIAKYPACQTTLEERCFFDAWGSEELHTCFTSKSITTYDLQG